MAAELTLLLPGPPEKGGAETLRRAGFRVLQVPVIRIVPLEEGIRILEERLSREPPDYLAFTSSVGVRVVLEKLRDLVSDLVRSRSLKLASIGPATTRELGVWGFRPSLEARPHTGEALGMELCRRRPRSVVLARSKRGLRGVVRILSGCKADVEDIHVYDVDTDPGAALRAARLLINKDIVAVLTSPLVAATITNAALSIGLGERDLRGRLVAIGPSTARAVEERLGFKPPFPEEYTLRGVARLLENTWRATRRDRFSLEGHSQ